MSGKLIFHFILFVLIFVAASCSSISYDVNGHNALKHVEQQLEFGYRIPGSEASKSTSAYIKNELEKQGWNVKFQEYQKDKIPLINVIAKNSTTDPYILLGTHYDTRRYSDQEPDEINRLTPVAGANDGASGTALLLEIARYLIKSDTPIGLIFFDGEDQGNISEWEWSVGAQYFVDRLTFSPKKVVIVDMIGDEDLNIFIEMNSDKELCEDIWSTAAEFNFKKGFILQEKYSLIDDHAPFIRENIPTCLIIDFDYPYWHTNEDTLDKVSAESLKQVGSVLIKWIDEQND